MSQSLFAVFALVSLFILAFVSSKAPVPVGAMLSGLMSRRPTMCDTTTLNTLIDRGPGRGCGPFPSQPVIGAHATIATPVVVPTPLTTTQQAINDAVAAAPAILTVVVPATSALMTPAPLAAPTIGSRYTFDFTLTRVGRTVEGFGPPRKYTGTWQTIDNSPGKFRFQKVSADGSRLLVSKTVTLTPDEYAGNNITPHLPTSAVA